MYLFASLFTPTPEDVILGEKDLFSLRSVKDLVALLLLHNTKAQYKFSCSYRVLHVYGTIFIFKLKPTTTFWL